MTPSLPAPAEESPPALRRRGRPRKDQSAPDAPRQKLLRAGVAILTEKGLSAVGIDEVLTAAGVPKGSFYHYFPSKEAFGLAAVDSYAEYFAAKLDRWFTDASLSPLQQLRAFIADATAGMAKHDYRRGCLVGNLGQEMGALPGSFRARIVSALEDWEERTAGCLRAAEAAGQIRAGADCRQLARVFWIGWEGAVLRAKLDGGPGALLAFEDGFLTMIGAEAPEPAQNPPGSSGPSQTTQSATPALHSGADAAEKEDRA
ncbi:TetR/AcrR family transcriptional regulator [Brevibacterium album]|uniref:acrylate utilization transcriptional regulator AcuR n=1 Tax=Brevibacterium album TaxID=417948 RepID=UPI00040952DD|nr:TetR/AcrR family transcriptional regulator [Brevibacterium album]